MLVYLGDLTFVEAQSVLHSFPLVHTNTRDELLEMCRTTVRKFHPFVQDPDMFSFDVPWTRGEYNPQVRNLMRNVKLGDLTPSQLRHAFNDFTSECSYTHEHLLGIAEELFILWFPESPLKDLLLSVPGPTLTDMPADIIFRIYNTLPPGRRTDNVNIKRPRGRDRKLVSLRLTSCNENDSRSSDRQRFRSTCRQILQLLKPTLLERNREKIPIVRLRDERDSLAFSTLAGEMNLDNLQQLDLALSYAVGSELTLPPMPVLASVVLYVASGVECPTLSVLSQMSLMAPCLSTLDILLDGKNTAPALKSAPTTVPEELPTLSARELRITLAEPWIGAFPSMAVSFPELNQLCVRSYCSPGGLRGPMEPSLFESCRQSLRSISIEGECGPTTICTMDDIAKLEQLESLSTSQEFVKGFSASALRPGTHWNQGGGIDEIMNEPNP